MPEFILKINAKTGEYERPLSDAEKKLFEQHPEAAQAFREINAKIIEAIMAVRNGKFKNITDAMSAILGTPSHEVFRDDELEKMSWDVGTESSHKLQ